MRIRRTSLLAVIALAVTVAMVGPPASGDDVERRLPSPESEINVTGEPFTGTAPDGTVQGLIDAHSHMFMQDGIGGAAVCGKAFSEAGIADALKDCPSHGIAGETALLENLTRSGSPLGFHDTTGWPSFKDWPAYDSLTHQQMYYRWVERAWRAGQRILVVQLTSNKALCAINPGTHQSCDEMTAVRRQARDAYDTQAFIDAQYGGEGRGWYRIVTDAGQAREVIEDGKLAVVLGVETSEPFGCSQKLRLPSCTRANIDKGLDELKSLGVSSMFLCHKFDNALCGVRYDEGTTGLLINAGQFLTTGTFWTPKACDPDQPHDNNPRLIARPPGLEWLPQPPIYPEGTVCNPHGLSALGEYALRGLIKRGMMVEVDHMSAKAAGRAFDILEEADYPGVLASHSWMDERYLDRLYALGGFSTIYGHSTDQFLAEYVRTAPVRDRYGAGIGFGFDMNGFGGTPGPAKTQVSYPFRSFDGGSVVDRQVTGKRIWDYNTDGVAHYGMIPDYLEDLRLTGGQDVIDDIVRGSETYLRTWAGAQSATTP
ncbi:Coagulation factor 5/8 type domain-containing protein [Nocardioides sp.]|uniref:Coagulation factor 5/8 type domain-containing protein n=1 Tax=Nocardioides sp. TaxID=35761 RepID=UPI0019CC92AD|nr:Coagulation factor 5/8 type domain-containing protein [Nocardioides sp.]MBC7278888.1 Coagulation factor 5/8 type domain-containing protein [Nocardioides sp.]